MKKLTLASLGIVIVAVIAFSSTKFGGPVVAGPVAKPASEAPPRKTLKAFTSEKELKEYFARLAERSRREAQAAKADSAGNASVSPSAKPAKDGDDAKEESITNTQHAGVDEGGIVKLHGDHLVILRRGRLFTVRIGDNSLKPVAAVNAYAPGIDPSSDWYDEMLISGDTIVVIGYSYGRGGTEVNLFDIDATGKLDYRSTYHLRSNDYYSSRNYASRLIGTKLIFYTPMYLGYGDPMAQFPAVRKWHKGATEKEFQKIIEPTQVYRAEKATVSPYGMALHTVTVCDLANREFACTATGTLGAAGRVFYVSPSSVYVWTTDWSYRDGKPKSDSMLYRMPLDGSAPSALGVMGSPVDQFSFLESDDERINVLVRSSGYGEQMWGSEFAAGDVALFRAPIDSFSDGSVSAPNYRYRSLPKPEGYTFQNRFVGNYLLYGTGSGWGRPEQKNNVDLVAVNWTNGDVDSLQLKHGVDRIEQMGKDAVVVGTNGSDLYFSPIRLANAPSVRDSYVRKNATQGELRSHGFFYKSDGKRLRVVRFADRPRRQARIQTSHRRFCCDPFPAKQRT
jgi:hypothetical protein